MIDYNFQFKRIVFKIRLHRELNCLSQQEMAEKLSMSNRTYQRIESCETSIDIINIIKICQFLKIDFNYLLNLSPPKLAASIMVCESIENLHLSEEEIKVVNSFHKIDCVEHLQIFPIYPSFKNSNTALFFSYNTKKVANETLCKMTGIEGIRKITSDNPYPEGVIQYLDYLFYFRPRLTVIDPARLITMNSSLQLYAYNFYSYLDDNIFGLHFIKQKSIIVS